MTIDKEQLKALAFAARERWVGRFMELPETEDFIAAANPAAVLALLGEIERLQEIYDHLTQLRETDGFKSWSEALCAVSKLKAENESLRKDAERYRWIRVQQWDASCLAVVASPKKAVKLGYDCPSGDRLDKQIDAAMAKEKT